MLKRWNGRGIWKVRPTPLLMIRCGDSPAISFPSKMIDPALGTSVPESMLKIVLFPEPFGPISPRISPRASLNDTLLTAVKPPKRFTNPLTVSTSATPLANYSHDEGALPLPLGEGWGEGLRSLESERTPHPICCANRPLPTGER